MDNRNDRELLWDKLDKVSLGALNFSKYAPRSIMDDMIVIGLIAHKILRIADHYIYPETFKQKEVDKHLREASEYLEAFGYKIVKIKEDE